ncbi:MAG: hypothetical protein IJ226_00395 [Clostridia bacterium]|nr:hypothetical protein [Clostridia bacterium]
MSKKAKFSPSSYRVRENSALSEKYSEDEIMNARAQVEREFAKKDRHLRRFDTVWTIISTVFAIITTSILLAKNWVEGAVSYVILGLLIAYVAAFMVLCAVVYKHPENSGSMKAYGKAIKIFKALTNLAFLVLTAITMAGLLQSGEGLDLKRGFIFVGNAILGVVKLVISLVSLARFISRRHIARNYSVRVSNFRDGEMQRKTAGDRRKEKRYR